MFIRVTNAVTGETGVTPLVSLVTDDVVDTDIGPSLLTESSLRLDSVAPDCCLALSLSLGRVGPHVRASSPGAQRCTPGNT